MGVRSTSARTTKANAVAVLGDALRSTAPGAAMRSPLTEAMTHAAASPDASVTGIPRARAALHSHELARSSAAQKSRDVPARPRPSTMMSATVLRLTTVEALLSREAFEHRTHALESEAQVRLRIRVREPEIALAVSAE